MQHKLTYDCPKCGAPLGVYGTQVHCSAGHWEGYWDWDTIPNRLDPLTRWVWDCDYEEPLPEALRLERMGAARLPGL